MRAGERTVADAELRVARERATLAAEFRVWRHRTARVMSSPRGLGAAAAVGFIAGGVMRRRPARPKEGAPVKKSLFAVITGLALSALRWRYGDPWHALPALMDWAGRPRGSPPHQRLPTR